MNEALVNHLTRILHQDPTRGTVEQDPKVAEARDAFVHAYEVLRDAVLEDPDTLATFERGTNYPEAEWQDDELDVAIHQYRFWWTWGN